jgi:hypothetical protein
MLDEVAVVGGLAAAGSPSGCCGTAGEISPR